MWDWFHEENNYSHRTITKESLPLDNFWASRVNTCVHCVLGTGDYFMNHDTLKYGGVHHWVSSQKEDVLYLIADFGIWCGYFSNLIRGLAKGDIIITHPLDPRKPMRTDTGDGDLTVIAVLYFQHLSIS